MKANANEIIECAKFISFFLKTLTFDGGKIANNDIEIAKTKAKKQGYSDNVINEALKKVLQEDFNQK